MQILYTAVFHNEKTLHYHPEKLEDFQDRVTEFEEKEMLTDIVHVYDLSGRKCAIYDDVQIQRNAIKTIVEY